MNVYDNIPRPLYDTLYAIYQNALLAFHRCRSFYPLSASDILDHINLQTILPPLISLLVIYFTLISLYHATSFFIRGTVFLVKWGVIIGAVAASLGYLSNALGLFDEHTRSPPARSTLHRAGRPRAWHTFQYHHKWRANEENQYPADAGKMAREMVEKFIDATQQAADPHHWWGTVAGVVTRAFTMQDRAGKSKKPAGVGKGKGKIR